MVIKNYVSENNITYLSELQIIFYKYILLLLLLLYNYSNKYEWVVLENEQRLVLARFCDLMYFLFTQ